MTRVKTDPSGPKIDPALLLKHSASILFVLEEIQTRKEVFGEEDYPDVNAHFLSSFPDLDLNRVLSCNADTNFSDGGTGDMSWAHALVEDVANAADCAAGQKVEDLESSLYAVAAVAILWAEKVSERVEDAEAV